jgi:hypothetical protein
MADVEEKTLAIAIRETKVVSDSGSSVEDEGWTCCFGACFCGFRGLNCRADKENGYHKILYACKWQV